MNQLMVYAAATMALLGADIARAKPDHFLAVVSSMIKVHRQVDRNSPSLLAEGAARPLHLNGARGEYVHAQVVIIPGKEDLTGVTWSAEPLRGPQGATIPVSIRVVGYLHTEKPHQHCEGPYEEVLAPYEVDFAGWWPDPLLSHLATVDVPAGACQPLWVTVGIPREARPGVYDGEVLVSVSGNEQAVPVRLQVYSFGIPDTRHLRVAGNYNEKLVPPFYGTAWNEKLKWQYRQFILNHRLNVDSIYYPVTPGGSAEDFKRLLAEGQDFFTVANGFPGTDPERCEIVDGILKRARAAGIPDEMLWFYGYDECGEDTRPEMIATSQKSKERYPQVRLMTTATFNDLGAHDELGQTIDAWCPLTPSYEKWTGAIAAARARGKEVWWYICCDPHHPYANWFVEYPSIEARLLMGMMAWKYQPDGFLYYAWNRLNRDPELRNDQVIDDGPLCQWNPASFQSYNGDGCLFYCGIDGPVSTIRLENLTDGLEDYEYFWVLEDLADKLRNNSELRRTREGALALRAARRCLKVPRSTVETLTSFTQDPVEVERVRCAVADAIEALLALGLTQG